MLLALLAGCSYEVDSQTALLGPFNNSTDPTNGGASYIGSAACTACHGDVAELTRLHGHSHALKATLGGAPQFPAEASRAGVPDPPTGRTWNDISYVLGGYTHGAFFVGADGFVYTDGTALVNSQWYLDFPENGTSAGFAAYLPAQVDPLPFRYECFRCHTVGAAPQNAADPRSQEGRAGILGTWAEAGVMCEACHGPGSNHAPNPWSRRMFVDSTNNTCARCHLEGDDPDVIAVVDGYLSPNTQVAELRASGGHADFYCGFCHDTHASTTHDRARGLRNDCSACHADMNLAFHQGFTYTNGAHSEALTCISCHMPYTGRSNSSAGPAVTGGLGGWIGDVRAHIFRVDTQRSTIAEMFDGSGTRVVKDASGRAAVTPDFVCLRCHNGTGNAFIISANGARTIAAGMHERQAAAKPAIEASMQVDTPHRQP